MSERRQGGEKRRQRGRKVNKDNLIGDKNKAKGNQCITQSRDNTQQKVVRVLTFKNKKNERPTPSIYKTVRKKRQKWPHFHTDDHSVVKLYLKFVMDFGKRYGNEGQG